MTNKENELENQSTTSFPAPENRATTHKEKREVLTKLLALWDRAPEMRLGQILGNAIIQEWHPKIREILLIEDKEIIHKVEEFLNKIQAPILSPPPAGFDLIKFLPERYQELSTRPPMWVSSPAALEDVWTLLLELEIEQRQPGAPIGEWLYNARTYAAKVMNLQLGNGPLAGAAPNYPELLTALTWMRMHIRIRLDMEAP